MSADMIQVEQPATASQLERFAEFPFEIYSHRAAWWPPDTRSEVELLLRRTPLASDLEITPLWARRNGKILARVSVVINRRYLEHHQEKLGHLIHFEAMPNEAAAVAALLEEACARLRRRGLASARSGFATFLDYPYAIDNYEAFPSFLLRATPDYYHAYFKNAGFFCEKGMADYTMALTPQTLQSYRAAVSAAQKRGFKVQSWREYGFRQAVEEWADTINAAFARHWGWSPASRAQVRPTLGLLEGTTAADLSMVAVMQGKIVGMVFSVPDLSPMLARIKPGVKLAPERGGGSRGALINIGVLEFWRGQGVNLALAASSFLAMAQHGMSYAGYTLVLDDNWPSRKTAEKLAGRVTSNFVVYRRDF
jgi:ribosomal protein S18 acetylase RimI-like enzyme